MINPNKACFIFDVDGTLSEPRQKVKQNHKELFVYWAKDKQCFISTGSDFVKVKQQIEQDMLVSIWGVLKQLLDDNGTTIPTVEQVIEDINNAKG